MRQVNKNTYPIPARTNLVIIIIASLLYGLLQWWASHSHSIWFVLLAAVLFAIMMIPVYSLIHEAEHGLLFEKEKTNTFWGRWLCCLFMVPFSFFRHCHLKHHKKNRTDSEMWDLYYEHQNKKLRYLNLYGMLLFGYFALWLSVILFAFAPAAVFAGVLPKHKEIRGFIEGCNHPAKIRLFKIESFVVMGFQLLLFFLLELQFSCWFILFAVHGFVWSSQNYVNHAFSPRDIINGAHNHTLHPLLKFIYLHFNIHLAHHQNPQIPWLHLPDFISGKKKRTSFLQYYLRLWGGPRLTTEPSPEKKHEDNAENKLLDTTA